MEFFLINRIVLYIVKCLFFIFLEFFFYIIQIGVKIIIRGKGLVKEGKIGRKDGQLLFGEDEFFYVYVIVNNLENVKKVVEKVILYCYFILNIMKDIYLFFRCIV